MANDGYSTLIIDTGADVSLFKVDKVNPKQPVYTQKRINLTGITTNSIDTLAATNTSLTFGNASITHQFHLIPKTVDIKADGILGRDFLTKHRCVIDYEHWLLTFECNGVTISHPIEDYIDDGFMLPVRSEVIRRVKLSNINEDSVIFAKEIQPGIFYGNSIISKDRQFLKFINTTDANVFISNKSFKPQFDSLKNYTIQKEVVPIQKNEGRLSAILDKIDAKSIPQYIRNELEIVLAQYTDLFCINEDMITVNNFYEQSIQLKDNVPSYIPNYKKIHAHGDEIKTQIDKLLKNDIIENSVSAYNSPILLVPKKSEDKNKKWRLVVDFRQLNKKIMPDKFPLPRIDSILDQLGRAKYFSTLDLMSGFHQIPLQEESRKYTAFSTDSGHFQFKRLPFGLNISPNSFQRMITIAMAGLTPECAFVYIDDIIITGCTVKHHIDNLMNVFNRLRQYNLKLNPEKCSFFKNEVTYLGHKITDKGIYPDETKYNIIKNYPVPKTADEVRRFIAFCNYYRKFVRNFAHLANPLNKLLRKGVNFNWTPQCQYAFDALRNNLMSPTILKYPDFSREFIITTDASDTACGAILSQITDGADLPVAFASKSFTKGERSKPTIEKELAAIHWAVDYYKPYVYGRKFKIRTDHRPLVYLFNMKNPTSKLTRMRLDLEEFDFEVEFLSGKANVGADALSRITINSDQLKATTITSDKEQINKTKQPVALVVNTRAMARTRKSKQLKDKQPIMEEQIAPPVFWETDNPSEVEKYLKIKSSLQQNLIQFELYNHTYNKKLGNAAINLSKNPNDSGCRNLEQALLKLCDFAKNLNRNKIAISGEDEIFNYYSMQTLKEIADKAISGIEIISYIPPKWLQEKKEIATVLENYHMSPSGGHVGQNRLYLKIREKYKWHNMKNDIKQFVRGCEKCKLNKILRHTKEKAIVTSTPLKPFEVIAIDTVGPLPKTANNNRYALTIQCELTKYVVLIPVENKEANSIARALVEKFILTYGNFLELKSDQGLEYNNEVLSKLSEVLGVRQTFATAYHPQTMGSLERNHRCLNEYLRSFTNEHHTDWDMWIKFYEFVYNTTPHTDTKYTPYELVFGRKANLPQEICKTGKIDPIYNHEQYYNELKFKLQMTNQQARQNLMEHKEKRQISDNRNLNPIRISEGDQVYIKNENRKKLDPQYIGPFLVVNITQPNCTVKHLVTGKQSTVHKNRLIK